MPSSSLPMSAVSALILDRAHDPEACEQRHDREDRGAGHIGRRARIGAALDEQHAVEREGREGGVAAKDADGEEGAQFRRQAELERTKLDDHAHQETARDIYDENAPGKPRPRRGLHRARDAVARQRSDRAAQRDGEKESPWHQITFQGLIKPMFVSEKFRVLPVASRAPREIAIPAICVSEAPTTTPPRFRVPYKSDAALAAMSSKGMTRLPSVAIARSSAVANSCFLCPASSFSIPDIASNSDIAFMCRSPRD